MNHPLFNDLLIFILNESQKQSNFIIHVMWTQRAMQIKKRKKLFEMVQNTSDHVDVYLTLE